MRKYFRIILTAQVFFAWVTGFIACAEADAQTIQPQQHPNHYILLIDASGSTVRSNKREAYQRGLTQQVVAHLYDTGFGETIPPCDASQDMVSLLHFGIIPSNSSRHEEQLKNSDFLRQLIHPVFVRSRNLDRDRLRSQIVSTQHYYYTLLTWARQTALWTLRTGASGVAAHRTFLIWVHDNEYNDDSPDNELDLVQRISPVKYRRMVEEVIGPMGGKYQFTDGRGNKGRAWPDSEDEVDERIFIEAYEVTSSIWAEWEKRAAALSLVKDSDFRWRWSGPEGEWSARVNSDFFDQLNIPKDTTGALTLEIGNSRVSATWKPDGPIRTSIVASETDCEPEPYRTTLEIPVTQSDETLGVRSFKYIYTQSDSSPLPFQCTFWVWVWKGAQASLLAIILLAFAYYLNYRLRATHIEVELPGLMFPLRLDRKGEVRVRTLVSPRDGLSAFVVRLPKRWKQKVFYRNAELKIETKGDKSNVRWMDGSGKSESLMLPTPQSSVAAFWDPAPDEATEVRLTFRQGGQEKQVVLSYPKKLRASQKDE